MAIKYYCDKCGAEIITKSNRQVIVDVDDPTVTITIDNYKKEGSACLLCPTCVGVVRTTGTVQ